MANGFAHIELNTGDLKVAKKFYRSLFDWKLSDMPGMDYTMIDVGKGGVGGGMQVKPMAEAPTQWVPYVQVDDVKKILAKAAKGGANVVLDYTEIGEMGAIGVFVDPAGATLGVWQQLAKAATKKPAAAKPAKKAAAKPAKKKAGKR